MHDVRSAVVDSLLVHIKELTKQSKNAHANLCQFLSYIHDLSFIFELTY